MFNISNNDTINENLLPCPFCGETPVWYLVGQADAINKKRTIVVRCPCCGTEQRTSVFHMPLKFGCISAEAKWNMRTNQEDKEDEK